MPTLRGWSDNPLVTRADLIQASKSLIAPLKPYKSPYGARIKLPIETAAHFDETAAQLEGFARPLWIVGCLLADPDFDPNDDRDDLLSWVRGLGAGTDPSMEGEYWGDVGDTDQRMVEMEIVSFGLLMAPHIFWPAGGEGNSEVSQKRERIVRWLQNINGKTIPMTNWLWFRVLTNLALVKTCGVPLEDLRESIYADLKILDSFEMEGENGWNSDGEWCGKRRQADYYSGSFAIQYSQLLFVKFASDVDLARAEKYKKRAGMFALDFMRYFDKQGASIPFGRSLTYRFAMGAFWAVVSFAGVQLPAPLDQPGIIKGLLLRHLRHWTAQDGIFHADGTLNIGYNFPNAFMCEDYNSPQSVYWCLKTLVAIALPADHAFWTSEELPHPLHAKGEQQVEVKAIQAPLQITCDTGNHHFLLSSGQSCPWPLKATEAKYGKFAYSSAFGFSVPTGTLIQQIAPDSMLALSNDEEESWRVRWISSDAHVASVSLIGKNSTRESVPVLKCKWKPWKMRDVVVETTLIPATKRWPDWHVRVHKISKNTEVIVAMEGGFAIFGQQRVSGLKLPLLSSREGADLPSEGMVETDRDALVISSAGASGLRNLDVDTGRKGVVLKPDSNTNLIEQRTVIPMLKSIIKGNEDLSLITGVFAVATRKGLAAMDRGELKRKWEDSPVILMNSALAGNGDYFEL